MLIIIIIPLRIISDSMIYLWFHNEILAASVKNIPVNNIDNYKALLSETVNLESKLGPLFIRVSI